MVRKSFGSIVMIMSLLASIFLLSGCIAQRSIIKDYKYLGTTDVTVPADWSSCQLQLENSVGEITIQMAPNTADYLIKATISIYGRDGKGSVEEANSMILKVISEDTVLLSFTSEWKEVVQYNPYNYELEIFVRPKSNFELEVVNSTGRIEITLADLTIAALDLESSTGMIDLDFSEVEFSASNAEITSSTGTIDVSLTDISYTTAQTTWMVTVSTGQITATLEQPKAATQGTRTFDIESTTGAIEVQTTLPDDYGVKISADTTTGSISIPGDGKTYTSSNFDTASEKYTFTLTTSTGSIKFS